MLRHLPKPNDPNLLLGIGTDDDAAVYKLTDEIALVQTVDVFTPIVDDPYQFGAIAAANALSDVYAKGGRPLLALNVAGFPRKLPLDILAEILRGGADKAAEAGVLIVGGHTIDDPEPKYGLAVTGVVHPESLYRKLRRRPGDAIYLTKPLGVGLITTAIKQNKVSGDVAAEAVRVMGILNRGASEAIAGGRRARGDRRSRVWTARRPLPRDGDRQPVGARIRARRYRHCPCAPATRLQAGAVAGGTTAMKWLGKGSRVGCRCR